jgi:dTDP-4-amino-4,6-dideoxygalactose transaminase
MIPVTKPFLPPLAEYEHYVKGIWERNWLTNNGPLVNELEMKLKEFLRLDHLLFVTNGTIAIQMAIKALGLKGKIITTPFSYVATTSSIVWENCLPVFVDIDPETCNIDPAKIEEAIDDETTGIIATHVYGNPCDVEEIDRIAAKHKLKVIYDGAHAFNVTVKGRSIFEFGDVSTCSFHATKLFHTTEGGSVVTKSADLLKNLAYLRNFGHDGTEKFSMLGINGKNSEFHAAMGLVNLNYVERIIAKRKEICARYDHWLNAENVQRPRIHDEADYNYAYYPAIFESESIAMRIQETLNANWIYPRRYFYPCLNTLPYVKKNDCPVSEDVSTRVLCLPLYDTLTVEDVDMICRFILRTIRYDLHQLPA